MTDHGLNIERAAMLGKLAEARERADRFRLKAEALCQSIRMDLNINLTNLEDMSIPQVNQMADDLTVAWAEYVAALGDIDRLKKALS